MEHRVRKVGGIAETKRSREITFFGRGADGAAASTGGASIHPDKGHESITKISSNNLFA
jgi:hypothetical protein